MVRTTNGKTAAKTQTDERQKLLAQLNEYDNEKYIKQGIEAHICQILNGMQHPLPTGIFIKTPTLEAINWRGQRDTYKHRFRGAKEDESGVLLSNCNFHVVSMSDLYIEEIYEEQGAKKTRLIGTYEPNTYPELKATKREKIRVRRFFTIIIVDDNKQPMHDGFLTISCHGLQSLGLASNIDQFLSELSNCFHAFRQDEKSYKMSYNFLAEHVFKAEFHSELEGSDQQSWVAKIKDFVHPSSDGSNYPELRGSDKAIAFIRENLDKDFAGSISRVAAARHLMLANGNHAPALPPSIDYQNAQFDIEEPPY